MSIAPEVDAALIPKAALVSPAIEAAAEVTMVVVPEPVFWW